MAKCAAADGCRPCPAAESKFLDALGAAASRVVVCLDFFPVVTRHDLVSRGRVPPVWQSIFLYRQYRITEGGLLAYGRDRIRSMARGCREYP